MNLAILRQTAIYVFITIVSIFLVRIIFESIINRIYTRYLIKREDKEHRLKKRVQTLSNVENNFAITFGIIIICFIILNDFINITPLLASAGVLGLALSLGAQSLIKDLIAGIFYLLTDQFGVGDIVQINGSSGIVGIVTDITLRTLTINDFSGNITTFNNSSITQITNLTKTYSVFDMTYTTSSKNEIDKTINLLKQAGEDLKQSVEMQHCMLSNLMVLGVESIDDNTMSIRVNIKTIPGKQFEVGRAFRYNLKKLLESANS